jgi:hypothetical protein
VTARTAPRCFLVATRLVPSHVFTEPSYVPMINRILGPIATAETASAEPLVLTMSFRRVRNQ